MSSMARELLEENKGVVRLGGKVNERGRVIDASTGMPAGGNFQARFYSHGKRLKGINDHESSPVANELRNYWDSRWLFSTTNIIQDGALPDDGLSYVMNNEGMLLLETLQALILEDPLYVLGGSYCSRMREKWTTGEPGFEVLVKILDIGDYINNEVHPEKDEMYVILQPLDPEFPLRLGYKSDLTETDVRDMIIEEAKGNGDGSILRAMKSYMPRPGMSVYVRRGMHHAPAGLLLELQRPLDDFRLIQLYHTILKKRFDINQMLREDTTLDGTFKDTNWPMCSFEKYEEAFFYEHGLIGGCGDDVRVRWVAHPNRSHLWSGKSVEILPNKTYTPKEEGPYGLFVWKGSGTVNGLEAQGEDFRRDELFVADQGAKEGITLEAGAQGMTCYQLFPRGVHEEALIYAQEPFKGMLKEANIKVEE